MFWTEAQRFRTGILQPHMMNATDNGMSAMSVTSGLTSCAIEQKRAEMICDKYVRAGARLQINLSESMRSSICRSIDTPALRDSPLSRVFDPALTEVKQLIWANVWPSFQTSPAYASWKRSKQHKRFVSSLGHKLASENNRLHAASQPHVQSVGM